MNFSFIQKYNVPGPRYTSYPTVPFWNKQGITQENWKKTIIQSFKESNYAEGISVYIHLPYCESMCTFCACHKHITKQHQVEALYISTLLKEWNLYVELLPSRPQIKEIHLGGGTPTFFSPTHLKKLIDGIFKTATKCSEYEFSFEGHPNNTTQEHLKTLYELGFRRCSFGIQDYDPIVQKAVNRTQSFKTVKTITETARAIGYTSVSHDLIFGLPFQHENSIRNTIAKTIELMPDRIAYYSYAHVPWIKGVGQRGFDENDLPKEDEKRYLYELGKQLFFDNGYVEIGMDHFSLPSDSLYKAMKNKKLHRNFMGYSAGKTKLMIGLGASSISDSWYSFAQNEKKVADYINAVNQNKIPIFRGHLLTKTDLIIRQHILNLMCQLSTNWEKKSLHIDALENSMERLKEMEADGLLRIGHKRIDVSEEGRMYIRNVCMAFDRRLIDNKPDTRIFSMTI